MLSILPNTLNNSAADLTNSAVGKQMLYIRIFVWLDILQNFFFLQKLCLRRWDFLDDHELLGHSFDLVSLTLIFWTHKDRFAEPYIRRMFS